MVGDLDEQFQAVRLAVREELSMFFGIDPDNAESRRSARETWSFLAALHRESQARRARRATMGAEAVKGGVGALIGAAVAGVLGWLAIHGPGTPK